MTDEEQHIAVVLRDLERGWNRCELEVFDESLHPDAVGHDAAQLAKRAGGQLFVA
jgi:hypothetical protein